jgi:phosphohistidine phosphatase
MGTRRLTLLRHGQAHAEDSRAEDFERTLTRRGIAEAKEMGSRIVQRRLIPDLILVSPAERAWSTASLVAAACELDGNKIRCARELYLATPETIWRDPSPHDLRPQSRLEPDREPPGTQAADARTTDRGVGDGRLVGSGLGGAATGDRRQQRVGRSLSFGRVVSA